jgi:hypothetical protein
MIGPLRFVVERVAVRVDGVRKAHTERQIKSGRTAQPCQNRNVFRGIARERCLIGVGTEVVLGQLRSILDEKKTQCVALF